MDGINVNSKEFCYARLIASGAKTIETRNTNSLKSHIGQRVYIVETGNGRASIIGECTIGDPVYYPDEKSFRADEEKHKVYPESKYYPKNGCGKYGYPIINPKLYTHKAYYAPAGGRVIRKNINLESLECYEW